jgi:hypothetical protein
MKTYHVMFWLTCAFLAGLGCFAIGRMSAPTVPPCVEDEHVTPAFTCVNDEQADYRGGYWYEGGK